METKNERMNDRQLEDKLELISQADIGYNGRRLTKYRHTVNNAPLDYESIYEPTPLEYAREIAQAQAEISFKAGVEEGLKQARCKS